MPAYVDESFRGGPLGAYVIAAALVHTDRVGPVRAAVTDWWRGRRRRFHWHSEESRVKAGMLDLVALHEVEVVICASPLPDPRKQERVRARCLERTLWELGTAGVADVVIEARQERNNQRDRRIIVAAQRAGKVHAALRYGFVTPDVEPLLWIPDAMAGAATAALSGRDAGPLSRVAHLLRRIEP